MGRWPFEPGRLREGWALIEADGLAQPAPGCVYDGARLDGGVPLGGLGTGYLTLEGDGRLGRCSIFNDLVPPRELAAEWLWLRVGELELPLSQAQVAYWGHHPIADMVCALPQAELEVGVRALTPLIPGDAPDSGIPVALFELELRNLGGPRGVALRVAMPEPPDPARAEVALASADLRVAGASGWAERQLPAGGSWRLRFAYGWHAPHWRDSGGEAHTHQYAQRYAGAAAAAADGLARFDALLRRTLAWQAAIYADERLPPWLRDGLVQSLYSLAKNSVWVARTRRDEWWGAGGWLAHNESHTGCPISETMVCRFHGHFPLLLLYPELELGALEAFQHFQIADGEIPFAFGMGSSLRDPRYHCQHPLNSGQYAQLVYRLYLRTGDRALLGRLYGSARRAIRYQQSLDDDGDGLVNEQPHLRPGESWPANQFYDQWPWWGTSAYVAGIWLATLRCGLAMAELVGDAEFADECRGWLERGARAYQEKLWAGSHYRLWSDPADSSGAGVRSDVSLGNQLMGEWCLRVAGLPSVLPAEQVGLALDTVARLNVAATAHGLVNAAAPGGGQHAAADEIAQHGGAVEYDFARHIFLGEGLCAAMTFVYHGRRELGLEIARRLYEAVALRARSPWNQRCLLHADSGLPVWGDDYYSNMVIWALPMALGGQGLAEFAGGELVRGVRGEG